MIVRLVEEYRRAAQVFPPGVLLDVDDFDEAAELVERGVAVPVDRDTLEREERSHVLDRLTS